MRFSIKQLNQYNPMTREQFQPAWEAIVTIGFSAYGSLTRDRRVWFTIEPLTTFGLVDHYVNSGADHNEDTIDDLEFLGFTDVADQLRTINRLFKTGKPPKDIDERNEELVDLGEEYDELLDQLERDFWQRNDALEKSLLKHIIKLVICKTN
jgi:hypothetical protein